MKAQDDDLLVYDEDDAVKFILNFLPAESKAKIDDTLIEYVLDVVYDFYDENGLIDEDSAEEASIDEEEMMKVRNLGKKSLEEVQQKLEGLGLSLRLED